MQETTYSGLIPIQKTNIYKEVIVLLNKLITDNDLQPGDRLPSERDLSEQLGISRTTLRQGIKALESIGRLETRVGSGTYVSTSQIPQITVEDIPLGREGLEELMVVRCSIEDTVIREFFKKGRTERNLELLRQQYEKDFNSLVLAKPGARPHYYKYNFEFEELIARLTGNRILILQQKQIHAIWAYMLSQMGLMPNMLNAKPSHQGILNAILENDEELARIYMRKHAEKRIDTLFQQLEGSGAQ